MKKIISFALVLALSFCLCGCGDTDTAVPSSPANEIIDLTPNDVQSTVVSQPEEPQEPELVTVYLVSKISIAAGSLSDPTITYVYDENGNILQSKYSTYEHLNGKGTYYYDDNGLLTKEVLSLTDSDNNQKVKITTTFDYNTNGNIIRISCDEDYSINLSFMRGYGYNCGCEYGCKYEYDDAGRIVRDGCCHYIYDQDNKLIKVKNSSSTYNYSYIYDKSERLKSISYKDPAPADDPICEYYETSEYDFDTMGNLIRYSETSFPEGFDINYTYTSVTVTPERAEQLKKMYICINKNLYIASTIPTTK